MQDLCKYKNFLGEPNKGVHSYRFLGVAIMDVIMTIIGAYVISLITRFNFIYILLGLFLLGILFHRVFCVDTTIDRFIRKNVF